MERETLLATIALHMEEYFIVFPIVQALPEQMQYDILEMFTESIGICEKLICKFNKVKLSEQIVRQTKIIRTNLNKN